MPPSDPARHPGRGTIAFAVYAVVLFAAFASGRAWLEELAALMLVSLLLWPALRRRSAIAGALWAVAALGVALLALTGRGEVALDFIPVMVNAALCVLFARTLARGSEPLIARVIAALETPARLRLPGVAAYARGLTFAWALLLALQATLLTLLIVCAVPGGLLASFGIAPPFEITGRGWRWYLHLGSYTVVLAFIVLEYAWRRWYLRHIPHAPLPVFVAMLARRWPALVRSVMSDGPVRSGP